MSLLSDLEILQKYGQASKLSKANIGLSDDGKMLQFLGGEDILPVSDADATLTYDITTLKADTAAPYRLSSYFLLCLHPLDYRSYRKACEKASCPPVKITDKKTVLQTLLGETGYEASQHQQGDSEKVEEKVDEDVEKRRSSHDKRHKNTRDQAHKHLKDKGKVPDKHHSKSSSAVKKEKGPVTNEQVLENLTLVADKKSVKSEDKQLAEAEKDDELENTSATDAASEKIRNKLHALLSERIYVTDEELAADREATQEIIANEMPVGNSFSVLRAPGRDLSKVLEIYMEVKEKEAKAEAKESSKKRKGEPTAPSSSDAKKSKKEAKGKPIIIVPNTMTSPITMINAKQFFGDRQYIPRQDVLKQMGSAARNSGPSVNFSRKVSAKYHGGMTSNLLEYEIMDNPLRLKSRSDWDRIVAIVAQGGAWQFKGWPGSWSNPVDIFSRVMGFYIGMEGAPLPKELQGWNVKSLFISRDKRIMDSIVHSNFFNA